MSDKKIDNGGPAFPGPAQHERQEDINEGMTLRNWLAGMALQGWIQVLGTRWNEPGYSDHEACYEASKLAYETADAMIARRED